MKNYAKTNATPLTTLCEVKAIYSNKTPLAGRVKVTKGADAAKQFRTIFDADTMEFTESMVMLLMNRAQHVLGFVRLSAGGTAGVLCDPKVVFSIALAANAHAIILCHNHPSGACSPSGADIAIHNRLRECGKLLEIDVQDSIILTTDAFYSFADEGII